MHNVAAPSESTAAFHSLLVGFAALAVVVTIAGILAAVYWPSESPPTPTVRWINTQPELVDGAYQARAVGVLHTGVSGAEAAAAVRALTGRDVLVAVEGRVVQVQAGGATADEAMAALLQWRARVEQMLRAWGR